MASDQSHLILNPMAGGGRSSDAVRSAAADHASLRVRATDSREDVGRLVNEAVEAGVSRLLVAGGDGTLNGVTNALMQHEAARRPIVGPIPCGSANDLCRSLGIAGDIATAIEHGLHHAAVDVDVIRMSRRDQPDEAAYAINAVTAGLAVSIHEALDEQTKRWWGRFAYSVAALKALNQTPSHQIEVEADGDRFTMQAFGVIIANGPCAGGQMLMPPSDPRDGKIEIALAAALDSGMARVNLLASFAVGSHLDSEHVQWRRAKRVTLHARPPLELIVDGEVWSHRYDVFDVASAALRVAAPKGNSAREGNG